uniref:Uncharacterized protein n=1 Tax=Panagrolaimus sp. ES5 TaxID=591445 RepID=A0AC34G5C6_9BILA
MTRKRFIANETSISSDWTTANITAISSDLSSRVRSGDSFVIEPSIIDAELEEAKPSSIGEEEMQLQIALALSREENAKEEEMRRGDDVRLQIALEESKRHASINGHGCENKRNASINGGDAFGDDFVAWLQQ